ncbi:hypothetical protein [Sorangium sp. So ce1000]|uniref:hypothetical protein n=1 Tax=Sorangium sp. So ce1000 TaxID=3133325 RepID=UPI003F5FE514
MSVDAGLTLNLVSQKGLRSIIDALLASRWRARDHGWWCVPEGEDASEWRLVQGAERTELDALVQAKMRAGEVFGIRLFWEGDDVGGEFLVFPSCEVVFSPTMDRVKLGPRTTDVSWYISRILPVFAGRDDVDLESWIWRETA